MLLCSAELPGRNSVWRRRSLRQRCLPWQLCGRRGQELDRRQPNLGDCLGCRNWRSHTHCDSVVLCSSLPKTQGQEAHGHVQAWSRQKRGMDCSSHSGTNGEQRLWWREQLVRAATTATTSTVSWPRCDIWSEWTKRQVCIEGWFTFCSIAFGDSGISFYHGLGGMSDLKILPLDDVNEL